MDKQFALLQHRDGSLRIVADYGDYAWNSVVMWVVDYYPTYKAAQAAARAIRTQKDL